MLTRDFDYDLPAGAIAQYPAPRGESRLLVVDEDGPPRHRRVADLPEILVPGDLVVVNDSRVLPARLYGRIREREIEVLLVKKRSARRWQVLLKPGRRARPGARIRFADGLEAEVLGKGEGRYEVEFSQAVEGHWDRLGRMPLPPYIQRPVEEEDRERYQTLFARHPGSIAAPTAGLHFSQPLVASLARRRIAVARVTLHVGIGTFQPVRAEQVAEHVMEAEEYEISRQAAQALSETRARGGRIVAVGTTVVRTLEAAAAVGGGEVRTGRGSTDLFITPGFSFQVVDVLLTNFHLPRSTLLMLVCAFAGHGETLAAYEDAVARGYRFYSYGDAMLARRRASSP